MPCLKKFRTVKLRTLFILIFLFKLFICIAQNKSNNIVPKTYVANYTDEPINIDGLELEACWKNAQNSDLFIDIEGSKIPKYNTQVKILWNNDYIYFLAKLEDPHIWGTLKQRDTIIFHNNDFEIFIDPDGDTHNYYEFEFNALNTVWDLFITKPYRDDGLALNDWNANGIKSAVFIDGTINNPKDIDNSWSIEIAIPLAVFKTSYYQTVNLKDTFWRINFSRVHWEYQLNHNKYSRKVNENGKVLPENSWVWSPQGVINMHQPETWGYVYFASKNSNKTKDFIIPKDEHLKWLLFDLYKGLKQKTMTPENIVAPKLVLDHSITPKYQTHETGYNIWINSPFSGDKIIINQNGKIIIK